MKKLFIFSLLLLSISCGKKITENEISTEENTLVPPYDTVAIDSFSAGATSVDVARQIRISSQLYQDSLRENQKALEAEKVLKEKENAEKKLEEEKKKSDAEKAKQKEKTDKEKKKEDIDKVETTAVPD